MARDLFVEERRRFISEQLRQKGRVSVNDLSDALDVSAVTIRHDLRVLEENGVLERTYGGAVLPASQQSSPELSFEIRQRRSRAEKIAIAQQAAKMVQPGDSIAMDASTTAYAMVPFLKQLDRLIVVTNSLMVAQAFLDSPHIKVLMPAGRLRRDSIALVGQPNTIADVYLNIGFFGARGISPTLGVTDTDENEVAMKRGMIANCQRVVIVAHHNKWNKVAPYPLAELHQIDTIITTLGAPQAEVIQFERQNIEVVQVGVG